MTSEERVLGGPYAVELLFEDKPDLADPRLVAAIRAAFPGAEIPGGEGGVVVVFHKDMVDATGGVMPPQTAILGTDAPVDVAKLEPALSQTWAWPDARATVARARAQILVTDMMAATVPHPARLELFQRALHAVVGVTRPIAIHWIPAGKVVDPNEFMTSMSTGSEADRIAVALNVRLFNVGNGVSGEAVMDTMGLGALALPDLQIHFTGLALNDVAGHLYNSAMYLFERGDVIEDGHTIQGLGPDQRWRCRHEEALVPPVREVLDLDPGAPFVAGRRQ